MKVFFDTNVYVAEALLGGAAIVMIEATQRAGWRIFVSDYVLDELVYVLQQYRHCSRRFGSRTRRHVLRRSQLLATPQSKHRVEVDPKDSPILAAASAAGVDYLVSNDAHLLEMDPYEGIRIISMTSYYELLKHSGLIP